MPRESSSSLKKLRKTKMSRNSNKKWKGCKEDSTTRKISREADKLRKLNKTTSLRAWPTNKRQLMKFTLNNSPSESTKLRLLELRKFKMPESPELPENKMMRESFRDSETRSLSCLTQMSVLKQLELQRPSSLFRSTTLSLRTVTLENSTASNKPSRKRKTSKLDWPRLRQENKKSSMRLLLKL